MSPLVLTVCAGEKSCLVRTAICVGPWFSSSASVLGIMCELSAFEVWEQRKEAFSVPLQICLIFVLRYCRGTVGTEPVLSSGLLPVC